MGVTESRINKEAESREGNEEHEKSKHGQREEKTHFLLDKERMVVQKSVAE